MNEDENRTEELEENGDELSEGGKTFVRIVVAVCIFALLATFLFYGQKCAVRIPITIEGTVQVSIGVK